MNRYYFDIQDSAGMVVDDEGVLLSDIEAVHHEAWKILSEMTRDEGRKLQGLVQIVVEVHDDIGPVMRVRLEGNVEILRKN